MYITASLLHSGLALFTSQVTAWRATFYSSKDCSDGLTEISGGAGPANSCHEDPAYFCTDSGIQARSLTVDFEDEVDGEPKSVNEVFGWRTMESRRPYDDGYWPFTVDTNMMDYGYELEYGRCVTTEGPLAPYGIQTLIMCNCLHAPNESACY